MKRTALLACLLASAVALAQQVFSVSSNYGTTGPVCSALDAGAGASIEEAEGYSVVLSANRPDGGLQSLFASGTARCCYFAPVSTGGAGVGATLRWMSCPASLDYALSGCSTGARDCASGDYAVTVARGKVAYVPDTLLVDGGTTVTSTVIVRKRK